MITQHYRFPDIEIKDISSKFQSAHLEIFSINHLRPTYNASIFFNSDTNEKTEDDAFGFAGSFAVFGHAECWGDEGHCHGADGMRRFDSRPSHPMTRAFRKVPVTQALLNTIKAGDKTLSVSIIARTRVDWPDHNDKTLLCCKGIQLTIK